MSEDRALLAVDSRGFVYADGSRICRLTKDGKLEFLHRGDRGKKEKRGTPLKVLPADLVRLVERAGD